MPDLPDKGRPSSPLSAEDADRLADSFTAFWEDVEAPDPAAIAPAAVDAAPHPGSVTAPMPAVVSVPPPKALGKQTLLGIAPITIEKPAPSEPIQSSPAVPGYAIAYTPKDPPSTPAVVIAPEAQSAPENQPPPESRPAGKRREFSQTIPSRSRSAPLASVAPLPPPVALDDFNPYAPKKGKGKVIGLGVGGALLLLASAVGFRSLSGGSHEPPALQTDVVPTATAVGAAPTPVPAEPALAARTLPSPAAAKEPESTDLSARRASEPAPAKAKTKAKTKARAEPVAAATRPVTRSPAPEPSPTPTRSASKGVIVRDAPF
ncbi:MAG TPA: hypothetical protein VJV79_08545 [Polyangiaceae bacterium]|nr:hypothetical protein [Polyangiaceae bacterium]